MKGIDCAAVIRPEWAPQLKALGYSFFARYYRRTLVSRWAVSPEEVRPLFSAGLSMLSVFQNTSDKPSYFTPANAVADANAALAKAAQMGQPKDTAIYFAVDCDIQPADQQALCDYFAKIMGIVSIGGYIVGVYGSGYVCETLIQQNLAERTWLAGAMGWRGSRTYDKWHVRQKLPSFTLPFGLEVDENECWGDAGLWRPGLPEMQHQPFISLWERVSGWFR